MLTRPVGRPPKKPVVWFTTLHYQAKGWTRARRVVAKVEWHQGELYPRVGFIVTNLTRPNRRVVKFYNGRGTAEQWIREGKNALRWTRLSCHTFRHNAVRLQLHALAYNLANLMRTLALPEEVEHWSLTTLREKLVKIGARIVRHGRYVVFQLAEVAVPRALHRRACPAMSQTEADGHVSHTTAVLVNLLLVATALGAAFFAERFLKGALQLKNKWLRATGSIAVFILAWWMLQQGISRPEIGGSHVELAQRGRNWPMRRPRRGRR